MALPKFNDFVFPQISMLIPLVVCSLAGCDEGPAVESNPQIVVFLTVAPPLVGETSLVVTATASSGLPVQFSSLSPTLCQVDRQTGLVTGLRPGTCRVGADQVGNSRFAPAPQVTLNVDFKFPSDQLVFTQVPTLDQFDTGTILAIDSLGASVGYSSLTPLVCGVDFATGLVTAHIPGDCTVVARTESGQVSQTITVGSASASIAPPVLTEIKVTAGDTPHSARMFIGGTKAHGAPIVNYSVVSNPPGVTASGNAAPVLIHCPTTCTGLAFAVSATNNHGEGMQSSFVDMITQYQVVNIFYEPDTQPNHSIFKGSFTLNATTGVLSNLQGELSESMTGGLTPYPNDQMTWLPLKHHLSTLFTIIDGERVGVATVFRLPHTQTLTSASKFSGTDGWSPGSGSGLHFGYPDPNPGNAYVRIVVNLADPLAPLTQGQIDQLAYADCAPGGMMGATCMTGTTVAGYGTLGTMGGFPLSQTITLR
jgi:hypothetical protein